MIVDEKKISKDKSWNSTYIDTDKWRITTEVIKFTTQNGGAEFTDELPGGMVKQRIAEKENKVQHYNSKTNNSVCSFSMTPSSSELSVSSYQSSKEDFFVQQQPQKSRIPVRSNSDVSSLSQNKFSDSTSKIPTPTFGRKKLNLVTVISNAKEDFFAEQKQEKSRIPLRSNSDVSSLSHLRDNFFGLTPKVFLTPTLSRKNPNSLFNKNIDQHKQKRSENNIKIYQINKDKNWVLISPHHRFIKLREECLEKVTSALTYREKDKVRVINLSSDEIKMLERMQQEDLQKNKMEIKILGKR